MIDIAPTDNTVGDTGRPSSAAGDETSTLDAILGELRLLTARVRDGETRLAVCGDWKFAATVVDVRGDGRRPFLSDRFFHLYRRLDVRHLVLLSSSPVTLTVLGAYPFLSLTFSYNFLF